MNQISFSKLFAKASLMRLFLFVLSASYTSPAVAFSLAPESKQSVHVLQGATSSSWAQISVVSERFSEKEISIKIKEPAVEAEVQIAQRFQDFVLYRVDAKKLRTDKTYTLQVFHTPKNENGGSGKTKLIAERSFSSLNPNDSIKFVAASCLFDSGKYLDIARKIWPELALQNPDMIFLVGDAVYADAILKNGKRIPYANPEQLWQRYFEAFSRLPLTQLKKLIPTYAVWDDHDYGQNNGGKSYKHAPQAKAIFESFFPRSETINYKKGPGVSAHLTLAGQNFFFMDNRTFRDPSDKETKKSGQHWGKKQLRWLSSRARKSNKPSWLINGDQFFGAYHRFESFEGHHPQALKTTAKLLSGLKQTFILLSGDRHLFEFMEIEKEQFGYKTYEITTSALHAKMYPGRWEKHPNPRHITGAALKPNYALIESSANGRKHNVKLSIYTLNKAILHSAELNISK